jgi:hypothetical protein
LMWFIQYVISSGSRGLPDKASRWNIALARPSSLS